MQFFIKDYVKRSDLESDIAIQVGRDINANQQAGHEILGTREEMKKFGLSESTIVFGIKCIVSDGKTLKTSSETATPQK